MALGLIGRKSGMTRVFTETGESIPVTVVEISDNRVAQLKTEDADGYKAVQVAVGSVKASKVTKSMAGHYAKSGVDAAESLIEFRLADDEGGDLEAGANISIEMFEEGQLVDVQGTSIGKGFAGGVKRHNFRTQDATHGNSLSHRAPGSIGQCQTPGRVFKGKKMAGHLGAAKTTVQNLAIVRVDKERNLLLIKGALPGSKGGKVVIKPAIKKRAQG